MILILGGGAIAERGIVPVVGGEILTAADCDVTDGPHMWKTLAELRPDTVIFTAGISFPGPITDENWFAELDVNLFGAFYVAQASVASGVKTMIFLASVAGLYGKPGHAGYSASKAGVISLVQSLGMEGHNAYAISPGRVDTPMRERDFPGEDERTRLDPLEVGMAVKRILDGKYQPGDNVVVRKRGFRTLHRVDRGAPWRDYLAVGTPPVS